MRIIIAILLILLFYTSCNACVTSFTYYNEHDEVYKVVGPGCLSGDSVHTPDDFTITHIGKLNQFTEKEISEMSDFSTPGSHPIMFELKNP